jgi:hypothetical protein
MLKRHQATLPVLQGLVLHSEEIVRLKQTGSKEKEKDVSATGNEERVTADQLVSDIILAGVFCTLVRGCCPTVQGNTNY